MITAVLEQPGQERRAAEQKTKLLTIASAKGGSGKTTTARNIAVAAAHAGLNVGIIDFDHQRTLLKWLARRPNGVPPVQGFPPADLKDAEGLSDIEGVDLVVIDTPPGVEAETAGVRALIKASNFVLVPTQQNPEDIESTIAWMSFLRDDGAHSAFLLNATARRAKSFERAKRRLVKAGILVPIDVPRYEDIPSTTEVGLGVLEVKNGRGAEDYLAVLDYLRNTMRF
jgi:chromosome partitioning protein